MSVPEGAVPKSLREELYLAVLNEDRYRPRLPGECKLFMVYMARREKQMPGFYDRSCDSCMFEAFAIYTRGDVIFISMPCSPRACFKIISRV